MNIKRKDLIDQLVETYGYTKKSATDLVNDFTNIILDNLSVGNTVSINGFGCFDILKRAERSCPHPQTGEKVVIPAHWIPRFYPYNKMKLEVKKWEDNERRGIV